MCGSCDLPEVVVHGLEEEFHAGFVQHLLEVRQGDALRGHVDPDQVGGLLVLQVVDDPGLLRHAEPLEPGTAPEPRRRSEEAAAGGSAHLSTGSPVRPSHGPSKPPTVPPRPRCVGPAAAGR